MIRTLTFATAALLSLFLSGCMSGGASTDVVVGSDGLSREVSTIQTSYSPKDTLARASRVLEQLALQRVRPPGYPEPGFFSSEPKEWPIVSDAFSGLARARTAAGETIELSANWQGQGNTTLKITTSLAAAKHEHLVDLIEQQLNGVPVGK